MDMKKAKVGGRLMSVVSLDEYRANPEAYSPNYTAIELEDQNVVLPVIGKFDTSIGISVGTGLFSRVNMPSEKELPNYSTDNIIDLSCVKDMKELMEKQELVRDIEFEMLTTVDNKFCPKIMENDSPAMKAMKTAVIDKEIDINKYASRFGSNFNNDKRQFNKGTISIQMIERLCKGLDIRATLTLEDKSSDVPNPIGHTITVDLTEGGEDENV